MPHPASLLDGLVIKPEFLASLRRRYRAELLLTLVQLEQLCPGWWPTLGDLAEQLGTDRKALNVSLLKLEDLGLLQRSTLLGNGSWVWWVKKAEGDAPRPEDEPAWVVKNVRCRTHYRVPISDRWEWARRRKIPQATMKSFLLGKRLLMHKQWQLVSTPMDCYSL
jgi:hypothetical protein